MLSRTSKKYRSGLTRLSSKMHHFNLVIFSDKIFEYIRNYFLIMRIYQDLKLIQPNLANKKFFCQGNCISKSFTASNLRLTIF